MHCNGLIHCVAALQFADIMIIIGVCVFVGIAAVGFVYEYRFAILIAVLLAHVHIRRRRLAAAELAESVEAAEAVQDKIQIDEEVPAVASVAAAQQSKSQRRDDSSDSDDETPAARKKAPPAKLPKMNKPFAEHRVSFDKSAKPQTSDSIDV